MMYLGNCKECGCGVYWNDTEQRCAFSCKDSCTCKAPYPEEFMQEWASNSSDGHGIGTLYYFWSMGAAYEAERMLENLDKEYKSIQQGKWNHIMERKF